MITLSEASLIVDEALRYAREKEHPPMTVAVLDARGCLIAFKMEDGSSLLREEIAKAKAWGALGMGMGTRTLATRATHHPYFFAALSSLADGRMVPVAGGVLIRSADGRIVGAAGVSGDVPDRDEACALEGIVAAALVPDPGTT
jgi:uncharacterized protein GlcG (DUF336 family)